MILSQAVVRFVVTHIGIKGERVFTSPRQGRYTYASEAEAQEWLDAFQGPKAHNDIPGVYGEQAVGTFRVCPVSCYPVHFDPMELPPQTLYDTVWDCGQACGTIGTFISEQEAIDAGDNWKADMIANDPDPEDAEEAYTYEVVEV